MAGYAADALGQPGRPDLVVRPADTSQIAIVVRLCHDTRVPLVVRGAGTGYTGGAVPTHGGVVLSTERLDRILEIDTVNLLAVVQPAVVTGNLQRAVEAAGLFYPPDPASLDTCSIGGNIAECAGGPRAFKYGTTKRYVLALEAVLATGEVIRTGSKAVKNVVGYDLTQLIVGSEGTLAVVTEITVRLIPPPTARATLVAAFTGVKPAVAAVTGLIERRVVPAAIELVDAASLRAIEAHTKKAVVPDLAGAAVIVECDGSSPAAVDAEMDRVTDACREAGAVLLRRAADAAERTEIWDIRRQMSLGLRATGLLKINHDVVVPRGRVPELFDAVGRIAGEHALFVASFGHAGDGNIHVNVMVKPGDAAERERARRAEGELFAAVVGLGGSISGEHGIGYTKAPYVELELGADQIALMKRVKAAFDPHGILNPGKMFP
jgi:glycolate oxidase